MFKKVIFILAVIILLCFGLKLRPNALVAQDYARESDYSSELNRIMEYVKELSVNSDSADKEILSKIDEVLSNQQKIIEELKVIKVRTTR